MKENVIQWMTGMENVIQWMTGMENVIQWMTGMDDDRQIYARKLKNPHWKYFLFLLGATLTVK